MVLGDVVQQLNRAGLLKNSPAVNLSAPVSLVTDNSKQVIPGAVFLCKGEGFKADYLYEAIDRGAACYVSEAAYSGALAPHIHISDVRAAMSLLAVEFYCHPAKEMAVVGITGTKGKTTAAYFLRSIVTAFEAAGGHPAPGFLSSLITYNGRDEWDSKLTTPEPLEVQKILRTAADNGCRYTVMEVSSQALKYGRVAHTRFVAGVYLNIGEDHVGPREHPDLEDYFTSKLKLFDQCATVCVNLDGAMSERALLAAQRAPRVITFSMQVKNADVFAYDIQKNDHSLSFRVKTPRYDTEITLPMAGLFNISNALAAIAAAEALGLSQTAVEQGLAAAQVPGRMEVYGQGDLAVIVDYAHNPMSLKALIESARAEYPGRELTVVFGCTGRKGLSRRAPMGKVAGDLADRIILTEDDPADEDVEAICAEIAAASPAAMQIIPDREQAVETAILHATRPAIVLIAGKGTETIQKRKDGPATFPGDPALVQAAIVKAQAAAEEKEPSRRA